MNMQNINSVSNGVPVFESQNNDICTVNAWLIYPEVISQYYTKKVNSFSDFNGKFNGEFDRDNINEFIDTLTATGKYYQICVNYSSAN
jgi:hypothetical protein